MDSGREASLAGPLVRGDVGTPRRRRTRIIAIASAAALLAVLASGAAIWWPRGGGDVPVSIYLTDLPGGFERLVICVAAVSVGPSQHLLDVKLPGCEVEISAHHGVEDAVLVAAGTVPARLMGESVTFHFTAARGWQEGAWRDLALPSPAMRTTGLLGGASQATLAVVDLNLDDSIQLGSGTPSFVPSVQAAYRHAAGGTQPLKLAEALAHLQEVPDFTVQLVNAPTPGGAGGPPGTGAGPGSSAGATTPVSSGDPAASGGPASNQPPGIPALVSPALGAKRVSPDVKLSWSAATDPDGDAVSYRILLNGQEVCSTSSLLCDLEDLAKNADYAWRVEARDAKGAKTVSPEWTFATNKAPGQVPSTTPAHEATGWPIAQAVSWGAATDPDEGPDPVEYRVQYNMSGGSPSWCEWTALTSCSMTLLPNKPYWWQITVSDGDLEVVGPWRKFYTSAT